MITLVRNLLLSFSNIIFSALIMNTGIVDFKNPGVKAYWQPPNYVFGIVWPILYTLFGIINLRILYILFFRNNANVNCCGFEIASKRRFKLLL